MKQGRKNKDIERVQPKGKNPKDKTTKNYIQELLHKRRFEDIIEDDEIDELDEISDEILEEDDEYWNEYFKSALKNTIKIDKHKLR